MELIDRLSAALAGRYEIEREIGRGGMAMVYLARDLRHERRVAIKVLRPEFAASLVADRFLREIRIAAQLQHPLIVPLHDSGATGGLLWYVMPYIDGETLRDRLNRERQLPLEEALRIAGEVAEALRYAHEHAVIHRDIKPENILLSGGHALVADFGIARAVTAAGGQLITSTGSAVGTPAYMSPEQGAGDAAIDSRSDIYSLGCVVYEMLAGEPPFTGPTPQSVIAKHISQTPPSVRVVRQTLPIGIEQVIERALAKAPVDRFAGVREFAEALAEVAAARPARSLVFVRRNWLGVSLISMGAAIVVLATIPRIFSGEELNPSQYVLAPFLSEGGGRDAQRYKLLEHELMGALRQVPDITVVESTVVNDRRYRSAGDSSAFEYWLELASALGAGRVVVASIVDRGDSTEVVAEVYDVRRRRVVGRAHVGPDTEISQAVGVAARLIEQLFDLPDGVLRVSRSNVEGARRAFVAGKVALGTWRLRLAEERFREAATLDPEYAQAHFWLAQTKAWVGDSADQWIGAARRAVGGGDGLMDGRERALAAGLLALAEKRFPQACAQYDSLVGVDSLDFQAWFGLGECHARDELVVRDPASPSGHRFRGSYQRAAQAYQRALEAVPSFAFQFQPLRRLSAILTTESYRLRWGRAQAPDTVTFAAYPSLVGDTLAFVPWPYGDIRAGRAGVFTDQLDDALTRNRQQLLRIVTNWVRAFPDSSEAYQALAVALELTEALDGSGQPERSALAAARRARRTAHEGLDSLRSVVTEIRVLVKLTRFDEAREAAVAALRRWSAPEPEAAQELDGLAALVGRPHLSAQLAARAARLTEAGVPTTIVETLRAFQAYAALGAPAESINALAARLDTLLEVRVAAPQADAFRCATVSVSLGRGFPQLGRVTEQANCRQGAPMLEMQWALARHDTTAVRRAFDEGRAMRRGILPEELSVDHVFHEAWALLQVGDTLPATEYLGRSLVALSAMRTSVVRDAFQAGGLVRAMALRAELAAAAGDVTTARRWAERVTILWRDADPELRPIVERMRTLVRLRGR